jgi:hypothetical protein
MRWSPSKIHPLTHTLFCRAEWQKMVGCGRQLHIYSNYGVLALVIDVISHFADIYLL